MPKDDQKEMFVVVDKDDNILGYRTRYDCHHNNKLIHRAIAIVIFNSKGELLMQKRSKSKDTNPGFFSMSAAGHVGKGETYLEAARRELFEELGIKTKLFYPSTTTELGKLFDTTYYGLCIAWHGEMKKICNKYNVNFEKAVTDFNKTYNKGYKKLGKSNVIRPVLNPPDEYIGGHCIIPNAKMLNRNME